MSEHHPALSELFDRLGLPERVRALIVERHSETHRHYHTLRHLELMLHRLPDDHASAREMGVATLFHDIVYEPARSDNEEQSLATFLSVADTFAADARLDEALISAMILATKGHHFRDEETMDDAAINILLKADLSILWHPDPQVYAWYAQGVRQEYGFVPEDQYREARAKILIALRDDLLRSGKQTSQEATMLIRNTDRELH